jgi:pimeloyl-ACP methyl ester carboxylesterase
MLLLSRRQPIPRGLTVEQHADDCLWAVERLRWEPSVVECDSADGPVGQWVATKRTELVRALILSCSLHGTSEHAREPLEYWTGLARNERWYELYRSGIEHT